MVTHFTFIFLTLACLPLPYFIARLQGYFHLYIKINQYHSSLQNKSTVGENLHSPMCRTRSQESQLLLSPVTASSQVSSKHVPSFSPQPLTWPCLWLHTLGKSPKPEAEILLATLCGSEAKQVKLKKLQVRGGGGRQQKPRGTSWCFLHSKCQ